MIAKPAPAAAQRMTTNHEGSFQNMRRPKAAAASAKSVGSLIDDVHTGSKKAAARMPTTAALMPTQRGAEVSCFVQSVPEGENGDYEQE